MKNVSAIGEEYIKYQNLYLNIIQYLDCLEKTKNSNTRKIYKNIVVENIQKMKELNFIKINTEKRKICTLLILALRLKDNEEEFTHKQVLLFKEKLQILILNYIKKTELLLLNRDLLREGFETMIAWE